jgi:hypothetical protein
MNYKQLAIQVKNNEYSKYISVELKEYLAGIDICELENNFKRIMSSPIKFINKFDRPLYQLYFTAAWANLFSTFLKSRNINLMEVASGDANYIINGLDHYSADLGNYITFNLNKKLSNGLINKNKDKAVKIKVIEDNGMNVLKYYGINSFNVIAFHHALNDIIQTIIAEYEGIDTVNCDWWEKEPEMLHAVMKHHRQGTLKSVAYSDFINLIRICCDVLISDGYMVFDNCSFASYESIGYSTEFHDSYISLAREWIKEANLPLDEICLDGYDSKWWLILRKR